MRSVICFVCFGFFLAIVALAWPALSAEVMSDDVKSLQAEVRMLRSSLETINKQVNAKEAELSTAKKAMAELATLRAQVQELSEEIGRLRRESPATRPAGSAEGAIGTRQLLDAARRYLPVPGNETEAATTQRRRTIESELIGREASVRGELQDVVIESTGFIAKVTYASKRTVKYDLLAKGLSQEEAPAESIDINLRLSDTGAAGIPKKTDVTGSGRITKVTFYGSEKTGIRVVLECDLAVLTKN
jgi:hypothetical protein